MTVLNVKDLENTFRDNDRNHFVNRKYLKLERRISYKLGEKFKKLIDTEMIQLAQRVDNSKHRHESGGIVVPGFGLLFAINGSFVEDVSRFRNVTVEVFVAVVKAQSKRKEEKVSF